VLYYASMLQCCQLVWILVRTKYPCLGVGCHITHYYWEFKHRLNSRARLMEMLAGDSSLNSHARLLECSQGTPYISVIVFGIPHSSPFGGGDPNGFQG
jgi:hypothetical protein